MKGMGVVGSCGECCEVEGGRQTTVHDITKAYVGTSYSVQAFIYDAHVYERLSATCL